MTWCPLHVCVCPKMRHHNIGFAVSYSFVFFLHPMANLFFFSILFLSVFYTSWWDPIRSKFFAGYWDDVIDCCMVPYDVGDNFWAKFFVLLFFRLKFFEKALLHRNFKYHNAHHYLLRAAILLFTFILIANINSKVPSRYLLLICSLYRYVRLILI